MCYANPMTVLYYLWSCAFSIQLPPDKIDLDWVKRDIRFQPLLCWCISTDPLTTASLLLMPLVLLSVEILFGVSPIPSVSLPLQLLSPSPLRQMETGRERNSHNMRVNEWEFNIRDISSALRNPSSQGHVDAGGIYHISLRFFSPVPPASPSSLLGFPKPYSLLRIQLVIPCVHLFGILEHAGPSMMEI